MVDNVTHNYVLLEHFMKVPTICQAVNHNVDVLVGNTATLSSADNTTNRSKSAITRKINKFHYHFCGHFSYGDMKTLIERNKMWNSELHQQLSTIVENAYRVLHHLQPPLKERFQALVLTGNSMTWCSLMIFGWTMYALFTSWTNIQDIQQLNRCLLLLSNT